MSTFHARSGLGAKRPRRPVPRGNGIGYDLVRRDDLYGQRGRRDEDRSDD